MIGFMFGFVSGFVSAGSCRVRVWCIFGSRLVRIWIRMRFSFGSRLGFFRSVRQEWPDRPIACLSGKINLVRSIKIDF